MTIKEAQDAFLSGAKVNYCGRHGDFLGLEIAALKYQKDKKKNIFITFELKDKSKNCIMTADIGECSQAEGDEAK